MEEETVGISHVMYLESSSNWLGPTLSENMSTEAGDLSWWQDTDFKHFLHDIMWTRKLQVHCWWKCEEDWDENEVALMTMDTGFPYSPVSVSNVYELPEKFSWLL